MHQHYFQVDSASRQEIFTLEVFFLEHGKLASSWIYSLIF